MIDSKNIEKKDIYKEENNIRKDSSCLKKENQELIKANTPKILELQKLKDDLRKAIKDERYEDAAKIRDEIKKNEM